MKYDQKVIIRFLSKEDVSVEDIHRLLEVQFWEDIYSPRRVRWWCQYVRQGRENLHDEARLGRRPIDFLNIRILSLLDEQQFHSTHSIADAMGISHLIILNYLREPYGMKFSHLCWIPDELRESIRCIRMETGRELLAILEAHEKSKFRRFVTGTESWFTLEFHHSTK
jgi:hypothetical protein